MINDMNNKGTILLVDDDSFIADMFTTQLTLQGYAVHESLSAEEALAALRTGLTPDAIVFNVTMPGMNGIQFLETLNAEHLAPASVRIALTNDGKPGEEEQVMKLGTSAYLVKATTQASELVATIEKWRAQAHGSAPAGEAAAAL